MAMMKISYTNYKTKSLVLYDYKHSLSHSYF